MEKYKITLLYTLLCFAFSSQNCYSQSFSETDIKKVAEYANKQAKGVNMGNGIRVKGCLSLGRTLIYQYEVPDEWKAPNNIKEEVISNFKTSGFAETCFLKNIDVDFYYFKGNSLAKKLSIKSTEFSNRNFKLGEYISIKDHPKAKEVNLKLQVPLGWEVKESARPNTVKCFVNGGNSFLIGIKDNMTFFSRKQIREVLQDKSFTNKFINECISVLKSPIVSEQSIVSIDNYPAIHFVGKGIIERTGVTIPLITNYWIVFYEDKIITLTGGCLDNPESRGLDQLYTRISNSVILLDQYN
jgi:hypothetical protein